MAKSRKATTQNGKSKRLVDDIVKYMPDLAIASATSRSFAMDLAKDLPKAYSANPEYFDSRYDILIKKYDAIRRLKEATVKMYMESLADIWIDIDNVLYVPKRRKHPHYGITTGEWDPPWNRD